MVENAQGKVQRSNDTLWCKGDIQAQRCKIAKPGYKVRPKGLDRCFRRIYHRGWNLQDFAKVNLAYDCEQVPLSLKRPHVTERVELEMPNLLEPKDFTNNTYNKTYAVRFLYNRSYT